MYMIRLIAEEEIDQVLDLTQVAFAVRYPDSELEEKRAQIRHNPGWGYFVRDRLASRLAILPLQTYLYGKPFLTGGVAHVASYPEHRRQGMVGQLLAHSLKAMKEAGQTISLLNPFSYSFYRKYGWETFCEVKSYTLQAAQLPKLAHSSGRIVRLQADDWLEAHRVYETFAARYHGMLVRDEAWWRGPVFRRKLGSLAVYYNTDNAPLGYMLYSIKDRFMKIHELVYLNEEGRRGLWQFIGNHDSMIRELSFSAPSSDRFAFLLNEPTVRQELHPSFMARIVDVRSFLQQFPFRHAHVGEQYVLHVTDEHAPWNEGTFRLQTDEHGMQIEASANSGEAGGVSCNIQTLSAMLLGIQRPAFLHELGRLTGEPGEMERWERLVPQGTTYFTDFF